MGIGENIRLRRKQLGMTLEEVAAKVGVSRQTMSRYETGVIGNIPSDKIEKLALALETTPAYLMGWTEVYSTLAGEKTGERLKIGYMANEEINEPYIPGEKRTVLFLDGVPETPDGEFGDYVDKLLTSVYYLSPEKRKELLNFLEYLRSK